MVRDAPTGPSGGENVGDGDIERETEAPERVGALLARGIGPA
jgi:hypothetical protein